MILPNPHQPPQWKSPLCWGFPVHGVEQPLVSRNQRLAGLLGQGQVGRIVEAAGPAAAFRPTPGVMKIPVLWG
jgi:hypothetical protein